MQLFNLLQTVVHVLKKGFTYVISFKHHISEWFPFTNREVEHRKGSVPASRCRLVLAVNSRKSDADAGAWAPHSVVGLLFLIEANQWFQLGPSLRPGSLLFSLRSSLPSISHTHGDPLFSLQCSRSLLNTCCSVNVCWLRWPLSGLWIAYT